MTQEQLEGVFGAEHPPLVQGEQLLKVLHGRRNDGTLDLPLSPRMQALLRRYPTAKRDALAWLRQNHPLDEDAAIMARLEREEAGQFYSPSELKQRAQDVGLYGPQSGHYHARLSNQREDDVWGRSELEKIRAENEARIAREDAELQAEIDAKMAVAQAAHDAKTKALEAVSEKDNALSTDAKQLRAPNTFEKHVLRLQKEATSKISLDDVTNMNPFRRIGPSLIFGALVIAGCYIFAQYWEPPRRADRFFPDLSLNYATIAVIATINTFVFLAWRFPPLWPFLNKYAIMTPGYPRAFSALGCTFSHQKTLHLLNNMLGLVILGSSLHEQVGRGTFLAIYLAGGVAGSMASLIWCAARGIFITSSLGASGSVFAVVSALCYLNSEYILLLSPKPVLHSVPSWKANIYAHGSKSFSLIFLPDSIKDTLSLKGSMILALLTVWEVISLFRPVARIDHPGHLGGLVLGVVAAQGIKNNSKGGETPPAPGSVWRDAQEGVVGWWNGDGGKVKRAKGGKGGDLGVE